MGHGIAQACAKQANSSCAGRSSHLRACLSISPHPRTKGLGASRECPPQHCAWGKRTGAHLSETRTCDTCAFLSIKRQRPGRPCCCLSAEAAAEHATGLGGRTQHDHLLRKGRLLPGSALGGVRLRLVLRLRRLGLGRRLRSCGISCLLLSGWLRSSGLRSSGLRSGLVLGGRGRRSRLLRCLLGGSLLREESRGLLLLGLGGRGGSLGLHAAHGCERGLGRKGAMGRSLCTRCAQMA
mmetsp:Transcript_102000/g.263663  ORF Transcript_102000/g.263663 Transcript_102000/m.263663 type:complete len:238 (-) Transcript_102000:3-716(-)